MKTERRLSLEKDGLKGVQEAATCLGDSKQEILWHSGGLSPGTSCSFHHT